MHWLSHDLRAIFFLVDRKDFAKKTAERLSYSIQNFEDIHRSTGISDTFLYLC